MNRCYVALAATLIGFGCTSQRPYDCVPQMAAYETHMWLTKQCVRSKMLVVEWMEGKKKWTHAYCVFQRVNGNWYAYDARFIKGSHRIEYHDQPKMVAKQLQREETIVSCWWDEQGIAKESLVQ